MGCNQNGKTYYNSLAPYPGGTAASTSIQVLGTPRPVGDGGQYCCDIRCICDLTYQQVYRCGNGCPNSCLQTEKVIVTKCIPCPSADVPTVTALGVSASPVGASCGCPSTNVANVEFAFTVATGA